MRQETLRVHSEHIASEARESYRQSDPYIFAIIGGELIYSDGRPVKEQIKNNRPPYDKEYKIVEALEDWVNKNEEGVFIWISAPYPGEYPITKAVASEIATINGVKALVNRALTFDFKAPEAIRLANRLALYSEGPLYFIDSETLRQTPIFLKKDPHWTYVMEELLPGIYDWQGIRDRKDFEEKEKLVRLVGSLVKKHGAVRARRVAVEQGIIGSAPISCPVFELFWQNSEKSKFVKKCPYCNKDINAHILPGYRCGCGQVYRGVC